MHKVITLEEKSGYFVCPLSCRAFNDLEDALNCLVVEGGLINVISTPITRQVGSVSATFIKLELVIRSFYEKNEDNCPQYKRDFKRTYNAYRNLFSEQPNVGTIGSAGPICKSYKELMGEVAAGTKRVCTPEDASHFASWRCYGQEFYLYVREAE